MPAKRNTKKMLPKKLIHTGSNNKSKIISPDRSSDQSTEAAIIRQFHQIQKGYSQLMVDVAKELDLVKNWLGSQAITKRKEIKSRLSSRLLRN